MRSRLSWHDAILAAGVLLLIASVAGLYADTVAARGVEETSTPPVIRVVTATPFAPLASSAETAVPTLPPITLPPEGAPPGEGGTFLVPAQEAEPVTVQVTPPAVEPAPTPIPLVPNRIVIPRLGVDAPVYAANYALVEVEGQVYQQWQAPTDYAAGWQFTSAPLRAPGNTVLNGHHNVYGQVFARLHELTEGDVIEVYAGKNGVSYQVSNVMILAEEGQPLETRLENAAWLQASEDERLTLVTCYPQWDNTHRVIVVARPMGDITLP